MVRRARWGQCHGNSDRKQNRQKIFYIQYVRIRDMCMWVHVNVYPWQRWLIHQHLKHPVTIMRQDTYIFIWEIHHDYIVWSTDLSVVSYWKFYVKSSLCKCILYTRELNIYVFDFVEKWTGLCYIWFLSKHTK